MAISENIPQVLDDFETSIKSINVSDGETYDVGLLNVPNADLAVSGNGLLWIFDKESDVCKGRIEGWSDRVEGKLYYASIVVENGFNIADIVVGDIVRSVESQYRQDKIMTALDGLETGKADKNYSEQIAISENTTDATAKLVELYQLTEGTVLQVSVRLLAANSSLSETMSLKMNALYKRLAGYDAEQVGSTNTLYSIVDSTGFAVELALGSCDDVNKVYLNLSGSETESTTFKGYIKIRTIGE